MTNPLSAGKAMLREGMNRMKSSGSGKPGMFKGIKASIPKPSLSGLKDAASSAGASMKQGIGNAMKNDTVANGVAGAASAISSPFTMTAGAVFGVALLPINYDKSKCPDGTGSVGADILKTVPQSPLENFTKVKQALKAGGEKLSPSKPAE